MRIFMGASLVDGWAADLIAHRPRPTTTNAPTNDDYDRQPDDAAMRIILHHQFVQEAEDHHGTKECAQCCQWSAPPGPHSEGADPPEQCRTRAEDDEPGIEVRVGDAKPLLIACEARPEPHGHTDGYRV